MGMRVQNWYLLPKTTRFQAELRAYSCLLPIIQRAAKPFTHAI